MRGTTMKAASICTALLGLSALTVACGDPDPVTPDSGGPRDSGQDSGGDVDGGETPEDAGSDAGTDGGGSVPSHLRLAHLIPGGPPVHICLQIPAGAGGWLLITRDPVSREPSAIPYKGVSGYTDLALPAEIDIGVAVYPSDVAGLSAGNCPTATTAAIITTTLSGGDFDPDAYYTVAATGIVGGTAEAAPELNVLADDLVAPTTAGNTRLRIYHAVPNFPATVVGVDLCFDPDGAGTTAPEELIENASFEEINDYLEHTPITAGVLSLHAYNPLAPDCLQMAPPTGTRLALIPVPLPLPAGVPANYTATFDADTSNTFFIVGDAPVMVAPGTACTVDADCASAGPAGTFCSIPAGGTAGFCSHPNAVSVVPIDDSLGLTL